MHIQLDAYTNPPHTPTPRKVVVVADATFSGKHFGMLVFRDPHTKENLHWREIMYETVSAYQLGIQHLQNKGFKVVALVIDGRRGVREAFPSIPVQRCHFHQVKTVMKYTTRKPNLPAGVGLRHIALKLKSSTETEFTKLLDDWYNKWGEFLKERTPDEYSKRKWHYTHKRLRSAYFSLRRNLHDLFTFERLPELNIPKTTNSLEGYFSHIKTALRVHRGLTQQRRKKLIGFLLRYF